MYFLDTEFIEGERAVDLISIAVVADDGREFYAISTEFDARLANPFVRDAVLPMLEPRGDSAWKSPEQILADLLDLVGSDRQPTFWTWGGSAYDWWATVQLFPLVQRVPDGWKYSAYDIMQLAEDVGLSTDPVDPRLPAPPINAHHALEDARWARTVYAQLRRGGRST